MCRRLATFSNRARFSTINIYAFDSMFSSLKLDGYDGAHQKHGADIHHIT